MLHATLSTLTGLRETRERQQQPKKAAAIERMQLCMPYDRKKSNHFFA
jgi:hypothetical protein